MNFAMMFNQIMSGLSRIQDIMEIPSSTEGTHTLNKAESHKVLFEHVTFRYDKTDVLKDVNIELPAETVTAFVGASGAGKLQPHSLSQSFGKYQKEPSVLTEKYQQFKNRKSNGFGLFRFQETFMLNDSIYQNIAIGNQAATREDVVAAAKAAQIHDFIMSLPNGYDTRLGEDGVKMSGGEKQRVCIARAILKDAPIIILMKQPVIPILKMNIKYNLPFLIC